MMLLLLACPEADTGFPKPDWNTTDSGDTAAPGALEVTIVGPEAAIDECESACFSVTVTRDGAPVPDVEIDLWSGDTVVAADLLTRTRGEAGDCADGLSVGTHTVTAVATLGTEQATATTRTVVHAFGYADGFVRSEEIVDEVPWVPEFDREPRNPVLPPGEAGTWDSVGTIVPSVAKTADGFAMWYAGTADVDYVVGAATSPDGVVWTKDPGNPLLDVSGVEGDWRRYSTNSPMVLAQKGDWFVYYTGRREETSDLTIGLAVGNEPTEVKDVRDNPVFSWNEDESEWAGSAAAHPSVLVNDDGWWEMWYSTGYHKIGYAYSADGRAWTRYCHNPVLVGDPDLVFEAHAVKAAEVVKQGEWYMTTYTAGETGGFTVGWAMSRDGLHWARSEEPVLTPPDEPGTWESNSVLSAPIMVIDDTLWMWYSGTGQTGSAIGLAYASMEGFPP
jgi:predicted GH43/DUF377 family glycosyl hydrolase